MLSDSSFTSKNSSEIFQTGGTIHAVGVFIQFFKMLFHLVMLVPDFTNQLFQDILHRYNAERSAKIVYNDGNVRFLALERLQDIPIFVC